MLRTLLAQREEIRTESPLETRFLRLLRAANVPLPIAQFEIRSGRRVLARADFAYVAERVAIELDGYVYHRGRKRFDAGHLRDQDIIDAGWFPIHFTDKQVSGAPDRVVGTVRKVLRQRTRSS